MSLTDPAAKENVCAPTLKPVGSVNAAVLLSTMLYCVSGVLSKIRSEALKLLKRTESLKSTTSCVGAGVMVAPFAGVVDATLNVPDDPPAPSMNKTYSPVVGELADDETEM